MDIYGQADRKGPDCKYFVKFVCHFLYQGFDAFDHEKSWDLAVKGGQPYGQPDRKYLDFLYDFPHPESEAMEETKDPLEQCAMEES